MEKQVSFLMQKRSKKWMALISVNAALFGASYASVNTVPAYAEIAENKSVTLKYQLLTNASFRNVLTVHTSVKDNELIDYNKYLPKGIKLAKQELPEFGKDVKNNVIPVQVIRSGNTNQSGEVSQVKIKYINAKTNKLVSTQTLNGKQGETSMIQYKVPKGYGFVFNKKSTDNWYLNNDDYTFTSDNPDIEMLVMPLKQDKPDLTIYYKNPVDNKLLATQKVQMPDNLQFLPFLYPLHDLSMPGGKVMLSDPDNYKAIFTNFKQKELVLNVTNPNALVKEDKEMSENTDQGQNKLPTNDDKTKDTAKTKKVKRYKPHFVYTKNGFRDTNAISPVRTSKTQAKPDDVLDTPADNNDTQVHASKPKYSRLPQTGNMDQSKLISALVSIFAVGLGSQLFKIRNLVIRKEKINKH